MIILVDVDGVVADLHKAWLGRYNADYNDTLTPQQITRWAIHEFTKPECGRKIYEYLLDPTLYDDVPVMEGAQEGVQKIRSLGHKVVFVSSGFFPAKVEWLAKNGLAIDFPYKDGRWDTLADVVLTGDKSLVVGDILIDDYPRNLNGRKATLLYDSPWNQEEDKFRRVYNWGDIYREVIEEYYQSFTRF